MQQTYDTPGEVTVELQIANGDVTVNATDTATDLDRDLRLRQDDAAARHAVSPSAGRLPGDDRASVEARLGLLVRPRSLVRLTVPDRHEDRRDRPDRPSSRCDGALGSLAFRTGSGDIEFDEIAGDVQIACASGDVSGDAIGGHLSFKGASGDLDIGSIGGGR